MIWQFREVKTDAKSPTPALCLASLSLYPDTRIPEESSIREEGLNNENDVGPFERSRKEGLLAARTGGAAFHRLA